MRPVHSFFPALAGILLCATNFGASAQFASRYQLVTTSSRTSATAAGGSHAPQFSADGQKLFFLSSAANLVTNDDRRPWLDLFVHDVLTGETRLAITNQSGKGGGDGDVLSFSVSGDGRQVVISTLATNLWPTAEAVGRNRILFHDQSGNTIKGVDYLPGLGWFSVGVTYVPAISQNGRFALFFSSSSGLDSGIPSPLPSGNTYIYLRDMANSNIALVSKRTNQFAPPFPRSLSPSMSADGRWVTFAAETMSSPCPTCQQVFLRDLQASTTISISPLIARVFPEFDLNNSSPKDHRSEWTHITPDGRYIVFTTRCFNDDSSGTRVREIWRYDRIMDQISLIATNQTVPSIAQAFPLPLVSTNGEVILHSNGTNLFAWRGALGTSQMVDVAWNGTEPGNGEALHAALAADGTKVIFVSNSTNLVPETASLANGSYQIYVRDLIQSTTHLLSTNAAGQLNGDYRNCWPVLSSDGQRAAFTSTDDTLVMDDLNQESDVFIKDLATGELRLISRSLPEISNKSALATAFGPGVSFSHDGRYAAFVVNDSKLVPGDTNGYYDVVVLDTVMGERQLASVGTDGTPGNYDASNPSLSADGSMVLFISKSANLFSQEPPNLAPLTMSTLQLPATNYAYVRNLTNGTTTLVATNISTANLNYPALSPDGRHVVFTSTATNLVEGITFPSATPTDNLFLYDMVSATNILVTYNSASNLASQAMLHEGRFSPDGQWLMLRSTDRYLDFSQTTSNGYVCYLYSVLDRRHRLLGSFVMDFQLSKSPFSSNSRYALISFPSTAIIHDIQANTNIVTRISTVAGGMLLHPIVNNNGNMLAFIGINYQPLTSVAIFVYNAQMRNHTTVANRLLDYPLDGLRGLAFANNDRFLIFHTRIPLVAVDNANQRVVYAYDIATSNLVLLTLPPFGNGAFSTPILPPTVTQDGQSLFFQTTNPDFDLNDLNHGLDWFKYQFPTNEAEPLQPVLVVAPSQDQQVQVGSPAQFNVYATATAPITYQWFKDGVALTDSDRLGGATNAQLTLTNALPADVGLYSVIASNAFQAATVQVGRLVITYPPFGIALTSITHQGGPAGSQFSFSLVSHPGLRYQLLAKPDLWQNQWQPEGEAITATGAVMLFNFDIATNRQRYFRIEQLP